MIYHKQKSSGNESANENDIFGSIIDLNADDQNERDDQRLLPDLGESYLSEENDEENEPFLNQEQENEENGGNGSIQRIKRIISGMNSNNFLKFSGKQEILNLILLFVFVVEKIHIILTIIFFEVTIIICNNYIRKFTLKLITKSQANEDLRKKSESKFLFLKILSWITTAILALVYFQVLIKLKLYKMMVFLWPINPKPPLIFTQTLFITYLADRLAICFNIVANSIAILTLPLQFIKNSIKFRSLLSSIVHTFVLYRALLPIRAWSVYLSMKSQHGTITWTIQMSYLVIKFFICLNVLKGTIQRWQEYITEAPLVGTKIDNRQRQIICSSCNQAASLPVKISCNHTFCHECILLHEELNQNCPVCDNPIQPFKKFLTKNGSSDTTLRIF
ncbi:hypothetical protein M0812_19137 [Anaeramoeba flamelloides]|uniref:RING-type domain-containing protein n=1 Tax=Anaeramoeba flamelloides TaxID=1746091 RepID=A0AAV7Z7U9_9EUKA|nr:hypothetical protein M0812_19137 [Anaeramoeba flamelloides]